MKLITQQQANELVGSTAYDRSGAKLGKVGQVFLNNRDGEPAWITAKTGMFGTKESFVPVGDARLDNGKVTVNYSKDMVQNAPRIESDGQLSGRDEQSLYSHYGMQRPGQSAQRAGTRTGTDTNTTANATANPTANDAMTRSEEQLHVGTEQHETGRARLRKHVVTEDQQVNVPVSHEEVRVEREPITEENRGNALEGDPIGEGEHEVTLHEERPTVSKEAHPVERVRMEKDTVREEETVHGQVRKERIESESTQPPRSSGRS